MAMYGPVGFLKTEEGLLGVDLDIQNLVRELNKIPYFGTHGVSCAGHFLEDVEMPGGGFGFITVPEKKHVKDLIQIIHKQVKGENEASLDISLDGKPPYSVEYMPEIDLKPYAIGLTNEGLMAVKFGLGLLTENGIRNQEDETRCLNFWKVLEQKIRVYNQEHNFNVLDLSKPEFRPIR